MFISTNFFIFTIDYQRQKSAVSYALFYLFKNVNSAAAMPEHDHLLLLQANRAGG